MDPTMSMSMSPSSTMDGMMGGATDGSMMSHSHMSMMGMDSMAMVFFTSTTTPLYSWSWMPMTTGQYAGTCIFLIAFATIFRALLTVRVHFYAIMDSIRDRRFGRKASTSSSSVSSSAPRPWRASEAVKLATLDVTLAGVSYLLMLAVMTMNVGYFLSILAGVFLGSLIFGHYIPTSAAH